MQLGIAIDNLRRVLAEERILAETAYDPPHMMLEEIQQALNLAQSVIPGIQREALERVIRALERIDAYRERLPPRGMA